jgi:hypothetical protein
MSQGDCHEAISQAEVDRQVPLKTLAETRHRADLQIHAFLLIGYHPRTL